MKRPAGWFDVFLPEVFSLVVDHLLASLVNMSGPSFGQRAIALTTSSYQRRTNREHFQGSTFLNPRDAFAIFRAAFGQPHKRDKKVTVATVEKKTTRRNEKV